MMTLSAYLKDSKMSQADFASAVGVKQPTVHRWLNGARPSWGKASEIERITSGKVPVAIWAEAPSDAA